MRRRGGHRCYRNAQSAAGGDRLREAAEFLQELVGYKQKVSGIQSADRDPGGGLQLVGLAPWWRREARAHRRRGSSSGAGQPFCHNSPSPRSKPMERPGGLPPPERCLAHLLAGQACRAARGLQAALHAYEMTEVRLSAVGAPCVEVFRPPPPGANAASCSALAWATSH